MGVNDAQEMLEAAQEECIRLERELAAAHVDTGLVRDALFALLAVRDNVNTILTDSSLSLGEKTAQARAALDQSPRSALAKVKADALRATVEDGKYMAWACSRTGSELSNWFLYIESEADRIEKEVG